MNKLVFLFILLIITVVYIFKKDRLLSDNYPIINELKTKYIQKVITLEEVAQTYFQQIQTIKELKIENEELVKFKSLYQSTQTQLHNLQSAIDSVRSIEEDVRLAKVLSYVDMNDFTKVWLDTPKENQKIEALIDGEYSAGIVINKSGYAQALLNGNEKCNYSVYIGENKAPGITHEHKESRYITIKFIPIWIEINIGDEVVTSGMDNIFFEGLKVGKVVRIKKMADIQEATVIPYAQVLKKEYFHIYSKKEPLKVQDPTIKKPKVNTLP